ncbi:MauE/DoxX family redox-associated membrane protein [Bacillus sp. KH172YL63]|uniref:MauE/DoxX family redox-associated membrane protein n=1 Tax=Bacillus sp. KH172YL63 TaxID=2709784 RepID=UPI001562FBF6
MDYFLLVLRGLTAYLFLSTAYHKISNYTQHLGIVENYRIIKRKYITPLVIFLIVIELTVSITLLVGLYIKWSLAVSLMLLIVYTLAVSINLNRGRHELSCGCGGIIGNDRISYKTIIRNLVLMSLILVQILKTPSLFSIEQYITEPDIFQWTDGLVFITLSTIMVAYYVYNKFKNLLKEM